MPRPLKVFRTHLGFFDTVVATPSRAAALKAWGLSADEFRKGFAGETRDPQAVRAALEQPGTVLYRVYGSADDFSARRALPKNMKPPAEKALRATAEERRRAAAAEKVQKTAAKKARAVAALEERNARAQQRKDKAAEARRRAREKAEAEFRRSR